MKTKSYITRTLLISAAILITFYLNAYATHDKFQITEPHTLTDFVTILKKPFTEKVIIIPKPPITIPKEDAELYNFAFDGRTPYDQIDPKALSNTEEYFLYHIAKKNRPLQINDHITGKSEYLFNGSALNPSGFRLFRDNQNLVKAYAYYYPAQNIESRNYLIGEILNNLNLTLLTNEPSKEILVFDNSNTYFLLGNVHDKLFYICEIEKKFLRYANPIQETPQPS